jgi:small subunit ribosomal protein S15
MLDKAKKDAIIKKFKTHDNDTGSAEVQIAILTEEIKELAEHLKIHKKDFSSRRGLLRKVSLRRRLLKFLSKDNFESYENLVKKLKLKKVEEPSTDLETLQEETEEVAEGEI